MHPESDLTHLSPGIENSTVSQISADISEHDWILQLFPKGAHTLPVSYTSNLAHSVLERSSHEN